MKHADGVTNVDRLRIMIFEFCCELLISGRGNGDFTFLNVAPILKKHLSMKTYAQKPR